MAPRVCLRDIASELGLTVATVSRALRNCPEIAAATRARVREAAAHMGYVPDPQLSALSARRRTPPEGVFRSTLGLVIYDGGEKHRLRAIDALRERAGESGYGLDVFDLADFNGRESRLPRILHQRGIQGILLDTIPARLAPSLNWNWEKFSVVTLFRHGETSLFHEVATAHLLTCKQVVKELQRRGYRRPGISYLPTVAAAEAEQWLMGFDVIHSRLRQGARVPDFQLTSGGIESNFARFRAWVTRRRPDVIIHLGGAWPLQTIERCGVSVPGDIGFCALDLVPGEEASGIVQRRDALLCHAFDLLAGMLRRGERGTTRTPVTLQVSGVWQEGNTLRPLQTGCARMS